MVLEIGSSKLQDLLRAKRQNPLLSTELAIDPKENAQSVVFYTCIELCSIFGLICYNQKGKKGSATISNGRRGLRHMAMGEAESLNETFSMGYATAIEFCWVLYMHVHMYIRIYKSSIGRSRFG